MLKLILLTASVAWGQTVALVPITGNVLPGAPFDIKLNYTGTTTPKLSAIGWTLTLPPNLTSLNLPISSRVDKTLFTFGTTAIPSAFLLGFNPTNLTTPFNNTIIPFNVDLASYKFSAATTGKYTFTLSSSTGANADGTLGGTITAGPPITINVGLVTDLNSDGVSDIKDLQIVVNQAAAVYPSGVGAGCTTGDMNGDGKCTIEDATTWIGRRLLGL